MTGKLSLPVDALLPEILTSLERNPSLVIEAPPGAGKTTRVPLSLLGTIHGDVVVLEPRRIAARLAARRVAWELGEQVGETVGYQVRFDEAIGPRTRLRFVTEGVLTRRLLSDPELKGVGAVVLDEFHERHLESDFALALLKRLQRTRPDLRIIVMSATLDVAPVAHYLGGCPILRSEGRLFEISVKHLPYSPEPLHVQVRNAVELLVREQHTGHILVFLPGAAEIRRAMRECEAVAHRAGLLVLPLHGDLPPAEQDRAVSSTSQRKLILATNVAESSVTVEGVAAVIDSGLARFATYSLWTGLPTLHVGRVSKASAKQRAGRAGRTGPGRVLRLYPEEDYLRRPEHDTPEIVRSDLSQLCLALRAMRVPHFESISWLDTPPEAAIQNAESLLDLLGATGSMAQTLGRYPLPPRLSRILVEALKRGAGEDGCVATALLGSGARSERNDLLAAMELPQDYRLAQHVEQLRRIARPLRQTKHDDDALLMSVLAGFPDRVARRRAGNQVLLSTGMSAELAGEPPSYEFMVAIDVEDRKDRPMPLVRMTARIEPEWLIDLFPDRVREQSSVIWNRVAERVESVSALMYDDLVIQESRDALPDIEAAAELLARKALEVGLERFVDGDALQHFMARVEFAGFERPDIPQALRDVCSGLRSFAELKSAAMAFVPMLEQKMDARRLQEIAPVSVRLQNGRQTKIHYESGKPPWIASRLQDFFGMRETPRVGLERTPVVVHLLAPNQRAVQTTTDLAGFWERLYPQVRRELMRRYPRHSWPEKP
ncbi:ATP-dependent helicase HrpB [Granulicella arctica]|uniref:ATP-dependent helicase HrpB n=1 Tax=Granulicella arctica TaxID=940613 RepID=A0A7Y9PFB2_9BACT|nr:ATP-dependent helicase HrpB [Granulicella arctica]